MHLISIKKYSLLLFFVFLLLGVSIGGVHALTLSLPKPGNHLVGQLRFATVGSGDTFATIARRYDVGYYELVEANPGVSPEHPKMGTVLIVPTQYLLPSVPRQGVVVNLATMRLYFFPKNQSYFYTYPIGIGRFDWSTPEGAWFIMQKIKNPIWIVPESILKYRKSHHNPLPSNIVRSGPKNPLGKYAMRLSRPTYLIHGTNNPSSVGRRSSAGCIHLYPEDIRHLFQLVSVKTSVLIINQPYLVGFHENELYLESHFPLKEKRESLRNISAVIKRRVKGFLYGHQLNIPVDFNKADVLAKEHTGIPERINI